MTQVALGSVRVAFSSVLALALCFTATGQGDDTFRVARLFADHMVLQRDQPVRVWGQASPGIDVSVRFGGEKASTRAGDDAVWVAELPALPASSEPRSLYVDCEQGNVSFDDVLVGDVWLCGGQSNMEWKLRGSRDSDVEIDSADTPNIRFLRLPKIARSEPQTDFPDPLQWRACTPEHAENCTAVGYYFARRLHRRLRVPIGLVDNSWGGTMAQHWCAPATLRSIPEVAPYQQKFDARAKAWIDGGGEAGAKRRFDDAVAKWETEKAAAQAASTREPRRPNRRNFENPSHQAHPGALYHGLIAPLARLSLCGALYYQGENNSFGESWKPFYATYPAVVADWRRAFGRKDLPIGLVQISGWSNRRSMTYDMNHHTNVVREVQFDTWQQTANTGLVVTFDTNSNGSIHPGRKLPVGERCARWALAEVYGILERRSRRPLEWRGPIYTGMKRDGDKIIVSFDPETARGLRLDQDVDVGFYIAGEDRQFHVAKARADAKAHSVTVWCADEPNPVAVRYGWSNLPMGGLMNGRELPAYPFRTDSWEMVPHQSKGAYTRAPRDR